MPDGSEFGHIINLREPTIGEILHRLDVLATCICGHFRSIHAETICVHPETPVSDVGDVLKCSKCKTTGLSTRITQRATR